MSNNLELNEQQKVVKSTRALWWVFLIVILCGFSLQLIIHPGSLFNKSGADVAVPAGTKNTPQKETKIEASNTTLNDNKIGDKMDGMEMGGSMAMMTDRVTDDESFLKAMIPHHEEAIESSKQILKTTTNPELKAFAERVVLDQTPETYQMIEILNSRYQPDSSYMAMMGDLSKGGTEADQMYIKGMIIHHQSAVDMANKILTITKNDQVKVLAGGISTSQSVQIIQLKNLQTK